MSKPPVIYTPPIIGVTCPRCGTIETRWPKHRFTTGGIVVLITGIVLVPFCIGIVFVIVAYTMRKLEYTCERCGMRF